MDGGPYRRNKLRFQIPPAKCGRGARLKAGGRRLNCFHIGFFCALSPQVLMYMDCLHGKWPLDAIKAVFSRRFLLQNCAVEVYTSTGSKYTICSVVLSLLCRS